MKEKQTNVLVGIWACWFYLHEFGVVSSVDHHAMDPLSVP